MRKDVLLYPKSFGPNLQQTLEHKLTQSVEGSCDGRYGFVIAVTEVEGYGKGKIREGPCAPATMPAWHSVAPRQAPKRVPVHPCARACAPFAFMRRSSTVLVSGPLQLPHPHSSRLDRQVRGLRFFR